MKNLILLSGLVFMGASLNSCGVSKALNATESVPPKLDDMTRNLQDTQNAIHKQTLKDAEAEMLKPENTEFLNPPLRMMIPGKIFADEATAEDLIKFAFIKIEDIQEVKPDDSVKVNGKYPADVIKQYDHDKFVTLSELSVIFGLAPQKTIVEMIDRVEHQMEDGNRFFDTLFTVLDLRANFINDTCIGADIFEKGLKYPGAFYDAINYINEIDYITKLPFKDKISYKITGMLDPTDNIEDQLDLGMTKPLWDRLNRGLRDELDPAWASYAPAIKKVVMTHVPSPHGN